MSHVPPFPPDPPRAPRARRRTVWVALVFAVAPLLAGAASRTQTSRPVELIETRPIESTLGNPALAPALETWLAMFRGATRSIDLKGLARDRDQLWAEAVADFKAGLRWHLDPEKDALALRQASLAQESVRERDAWEACIQTHLSQQQSDFVTTGELLKACGVERDRWALAEQRRVGSIIKGLGWQRRQPYDELAPFARLALAIDFAAVKVYQVACEEQAQPGSGDPLDVVTLNALELAE